MAEHKRRAAFGAAHNKMVKRKKKGLKKSTKKKIQSSFKRPGR